MNQGITITIPTTLTKKKDFVVIPRSEYEDFLRFKQIKEFTPSVAHRRALLKAEKELQGGKTLSYDECLSKLGLAD